MADQDSEGFDREYWASTLKLSAKQRAYCYARLEGENQIEAAKRAGYGINAKPNTLRGMATDVERSTKVKSFMAAAAQYAAGNTSAGPIEAGTLKEIEAKLWLQLRVGDHGAQSRALDHMMKLGLIAPKPAEPESDPIAILKEIYSTSPALAKQLADEQGIDFGQIEPRFNGTNIVELRTDT